MYPRCYFILYQKNCRVENLMLSLYTHTHTIHTDVHISKRVTPDASEQRNTLRIRLVHSHKINYACR